MPLTAPAAHRRAATGRGRDRGRGTSRPGPPSRFPMGPCPTYRQILRILPGLILALSLATLNQTMVTVALPTIVGEFHRSDLLPWLVSAYLRPFAISAPLYGKLGDLFGRRTVLQSSLVVFLAGSALAGLAQSPSQLIGFRVVQGLGGGGLVSASMAVVGETIPPPPLSWSD